MAHLTIISSLLVSLVEASAYGWMVTFVMVGVNRVTLLIIQDYPKKKILLSRPSNAGDLFE